MKRLRVYLSSTYEDLKDYRAAVFAALERAGLDVARMEAYTAADERPLDHCLRDVAQSDIYLGLFAWRYGYEPPANHGNADGKSITELEYRQAERGNLRKLLFFTHSDAKASWPDRFKDEVTGDGARGEKLNGLRKELGTEKSASFFHTPDELATLVLAAIMRTGLSGRAYNVPPRPAGFVPRPALTKQLVDSLSGSGRVAGVHTVVQGAGGIGKTTLALDACHIPEIVREFPDGILWAALGEKPDLARILGDLHVAATGSPAGVIGVDAIGQALGKALVGCRCLIVIDDAWRADDLQHFLALDGPQLLVTTRIRNLVEQAGLTRWREVSVDEMEAKEGATLLGRGLPLDTGTWDLLRELADRLGCWPLLLELVNSRLLEEQKSRQRPLAEYIDRVAQLFERRGVLGFDRRDSKARNAAVEKSVAVGLDFAEEGFPAIGEKAAEISVFPEDIAIPARVLTDLWAMNELDVEEEVLRPLDNISILRWDRQTNEVALHDMIRRALAARLAEPAAVHRKLLDRWRDPYRLPHDYAWRWFGWHCVRAAEPDRLPGLLLDFDWLWSKLAATEINGLLAEFERVRGNPQTELLERACRQSAYVLAKDKSQLAGQLLARIPEKEQPLRARIVERARAIREPWLRPVTASLAAERSIRWLRPSGEEALTEVAFSRNSQWAAHFSYSSDSGSVDLWDLREWRSLGPRFQTLGRFRPYALALSDDARWCLYADSIGGVHRLGDAGEVWEGRAHRDVTIAELVAISADGRRALSACQHGRLVAWDIDADRHEVIWDESDNHVRALSLDAAGTSAVVAREDGSVTLLDLWPRREQTLWRLHGQPTALARSADNTVVVAAAADGRIEVRSVESPEPAISIFATEEQPTSMAVPADARYVAVGTAKGTVEVWNVARGARSARYSRAHTYEVECITFSHDGARLVSADALHIKEWALEVPEEAAGLTGCRAQGQVKVTADGQRAVAVLEDGRLGVWNLRTGGLESALPYTSGPAFGDADVGPAKGIALATKAPCALAWNEKLLGVWDLAEGAHVGSLRVADTRDAAITPDGRGVVYVSGMDITLWRPDGGNPEVLGTYDGDAPGYVAISPDGQRALSSGGDRQVHMWRLDGPSQRQHIEEFRRQMKRESHLDPRIIDARWQSRFAPDASYWPDARDKPSFVAFAAPNVAIVTTGDGSLFELDIMRDEPPKPMELHGMKLSDRHAAGVARMLVGPEGSFFVTSSYDRTVRLWHSWDCIALLDAHPGIVERLSISAKRMLLHSQDGVLKVLLLPDGALLAAFQGDKQIVTCDADAELQWVVALDQGGQMHFLCVEDGL